ncbi:MULTISPECIES: hypothetical protein [unclassified Rhodococcus (in: high G+C Gram-positive bacteria)]|uniref:hypothetical protein n=1 Tax=unclassified Rhodococcus (in: high G+C Gram-positive bacteria) TaxID=192944 RepID=UPI00117AAAA6|nr:MULTISPECIES: hypothetical protein [unclassified Rhodococcus (in: high G+C Gram-positive bacteria)]
MAEERRTGIEPLHDQVAIECLDGVAAGAKGRASVGLCRGDVARLFVHVHRSAHNTSACTLICFSLEQLTATEHIGFDCLELLPALESSVRLDNPVHSVVMYSSDLLMA